MRTASRLRIVLAWILKNNTFCTLLLLQSRRVRTLRVAVHAIGTAVLHSLSIRRQSTHRDGDIAYKYGKRRRTSAKRRRGSAAVCVCVCVGTRPFFKRGFGEVARRRCARRAAERKVPAKRTERRLHPLVYQSMNVAAAPRTRRARGLASRGALLVPVHPPARHDIGGGDGDGGKPSRRPFALPTRPQPHFPSLGPAVRAAFSHAAVAYRRAVHTVPICLVSFVFFFFFYLRAIIFSTICVLIFRIFVLFFCFFLAHF